ncbi:ShlB/FhaC/HecB family hemolysin secretion/activation protein [Vibrio sp. MACH09]|uniref:ShlB/FhaC/HecB family hemolysin secretion/activation protein n=1 Tax=Vibrio sp. MACH09 TaxID=3025122 RepID=UPI00295F28F1|nr:ShlB/FhaC/HecB family hemolysin secretion/activation protein [Vibrio sp. MACH09]
MNSNLVGNYLVGQSWQRLLNIVQLSLLLLFLCFAKQSYALSPSAKQSIELEQQRRLQQLEEAKQAVESLQPLPTIEQPTLPSSSNCFEIKRILFSGNTLFTSEQLQQEIKFEARCIGIDEINQYLSVISNLYIKNGYVTSRAFLTPQDLTSGVLEIFILEGKVEALLFNNKPARFLDNALPSIVGEILNLRDIEQGLDQINRLSRYNAKIQLPPGTKQGYSIINVQATSAGIVSGSIGVDNGGQENTGETQLSMTLKADNLLNGLEQWTLSAKKSSEFRTSQDSQNVAFSIDIPRGYWNASYRTSYSDYKQSIDNNSFTFQSTGRTNSHDADISWLYSRDSDSKTLFKLGVHHRREKNYIMDTLLETGSRNLSSASLSVDYSSRFIGGFITLSPRYVTGTDWFGGEDDSQKTSMMPKALFEKLTLATSYTYPLSQVVTLNSTLFGQWSDDTLYGSQRLSIGGLYSVRGFKDTSISGDQGYYWRNEITHRLGQLPYIGNVSTQWAIDTGSIVKDSRDALEKGSLMGAYVAINTRSTLLSSQFSIGLPIETPSRLKGDDYVVNYQLTMAF